MVNIDRKALYQLYERLDEKMTSEQRLCVIGAAAVLGAGHSRRQTQDIDVWRPASSINDRDLAQASRAAGIECDPMDLVVDGIYLQTIMPGVVQLPEFKNGVWATGAPSEPLWQGTRLTVVAPPAAIVVAAKLIRALDRDIDDCAFLMEAKRIDLDDVRKAISKIPNRPDRETATENLVFLSMMEDGPDGRSGLDRDDEGREP